MCREVVTRECIDCGKDVEDTPMVCEDCLPDMPDLDELEITRTNTMSAKIGHCKDCDSILELHKNSLSGLVIRCDCNMTRSIKIAQATPESWVV